MIEILFKRNGVVSLGAISKEKDVQQNCLFLINGPPRDFSCQVCRRHMSELKPFGGPGDLLVGDFTGELLVKKWRLDAPYSEEVEKAWEEVGKEVPAREDPLPWFISKYGKETGEKFYWWGEGYGSIGASWECRDCIVLDQYEYFEKLRERYQKDKT